MCAVTYLLLMTVINLAYKPSVDTRSYASCEGYRTVRCPSKVQFLMLKTLLWASVAFLVVALLTDKYLKKLGIKALVGEMPSLMAQVAQFVVKLAIGFVSKSSNKMSVLGHYVVHV